MAQLNSLIVTGNTVLHGDANITSINGVSVGSAPRFNYTTTAPTYTVTSTSSSNKWTNAAILASKWGNVVQMVFTVKGTGAQVAAGTDGYAGKVSGTYMPARQVTLIGYTGSAMLMGWMETNGDITIRASELTNIGSTNTLWLTATFLTNTNE